MDQLDHRDQEDLVVLELMMAYQEHLECLVHRFLVILQDLFLQEDLEDRQDLVVLGFQVYPLLLDQSHLVRLVLLVHLPRLEDQPHLERLLNLYHLLHQE